MNGHNLQTDIPNKAYWDHRSVGTLLRNSLVLGKSQFATLISANHASRIERELSECSFNVSYESLPPYLLSSGYSGERILTVTSSRSLCTRSRSNSLCSAPSFAPRNPEADLQSLLPKQVMPFLIGLKTAKPAILSGGQRQSHSSRLAQ